MTTSSFPGVNANMFWFVAVIESIDDPDKAGKVRIRVIGKDSIDKTAAPSESLPWAPCIVSANMSRKTIDARPKDWVIGFYLDGHHAMQPIVLGIIPGITTTTGEAA
jgi:hypothetical protein